MGKTTMRIGLVVLAMAAGGCATVGKVAGGTAGAVGGLVGGLTCGPAFMVCSPLYAGKFGEDGARLGNAIGAFIERQAQRDPEREALEARSKKQDAPEPAPPPEETPEPVEPPTPAALRALTLPSVGSSWTYEYADKLYRVGKKQPVRFTVRVGSADGHTVGEYFSRGAPRALDAHSADFVEHRMGAGATVVEFAPYLLAARGEEASSAAIDVAGYPVDNGTPEWITQASPPVWERITVAAGTFEALRLEYRGRRVRSPFSPIVTYRFAVRVWYAPEVKRYVRLEREEWLHSQAATHTVVELQEFNQPS